MWMRITQKYDAAYVDMPLVNYHLVHSQREQVSDKAAQEIARVRKNIRETCHILEKNKEYFAKYKYAQWVRLSGLAVSYRKNSELGKSLRTFFRAISLQPLRIMGNLSLMLKIIMPSGIRLVGKIRESLRKILPEKLFWTLSSCYRKVMRKIC